MSRWLRRPVWFNHSRITLEFQSDGHVVLLLPTVTGGRIKEFDGIPNQEAEHEAFSHNQEKMPSLMISSKSSFQGPVWSTLGCWNLPAFTLVLSSKSSLKARKLEMHVLPQIAEDFVLLSFSCRDQLEREVVFLLSNVVLPSPTSFPLPKDASPYLLHLRRIHCLLV